MPPGKHGLLKAVAKWQGKQICRRLKVGADAYILQGCFINTTALMFLSFHGEHLTQKQMIKQATQQLQFQNPANERDK